VPQSRYSLSQKRKNKMSEKDYKTVEAMARFGGSFVKELAVLASRADPENLKKIKDTWPEYWSRYEKMAEESNG
jgi:hypothetical protein